jgi:endonuclease-3
MGKSAKPPNLLERVRDILLPIWPDAKPLLSYANCFELLCSVILSAQCTDEQVNSVTPVLFAAYPDPGRMSRASLEHVETIIHSVGFFHTKARHLIQSSAIICEKFGGRVPQAFEDLLSLPGVGRKTANLVASACFGTPGVIVDTHVLRVALRLGIHDARDPAAVETKIRALVPEADLTSFSHALNRHGKFVCKARNPQCVVLGPPCPLLGLCPRIGLDID